MRPLQCFGQGRRSTNPGGGHHLVGWGVITFSIHRHLGGQRFSNSNMLLRLCRIGFRLEQTSTGVWASMVTTPMPLLSAIPATGFGFLAIHLIARQLGLVRHGRGSPFTISSILFDLCDLVACLTHCNQRLGCLLNAGFQGL